MRILWLKTELLHPVDKGGRIRTYEMLRELARRHAVTYLTLDDGTAAPDAAARAQEYCTELITVPFRPPAAGSAGFYAALARNVASPLPYAVARYHHRPFADAIARVLAEGRFDVVIADFLPPTVNLPGQLPVYTVLFQHNVEAEIWRRRTDVATNPVARAYLRTQLRRMERYEREACHRVDRVIAVSEADAEHFRRVYGVASAVAIPTGVDTAYFQPQGFGPREERHLVFTGSMDWMPNEDGILFFTEQVMPQLRRLVPGVRLTVVGRKPPTRIQALAERHPDIVVTGRVEDVRPYLARATAAVVPLRVGGGTRLKIYEAMAMECPVVSTTIGAEGLPVRDGGHLRLADTADALASACAEVLRHPERRNALATAAAAHVRQHFGWSGVAAAFEALCIPPAGTKEAA